MSHMLRAFIVKQLGTVMQERGEINPKDPTVHTKATGAEAEKFAMRTSPRVLTLTMLYTLRCRARKEGMIGHKLAADESAACSSKPPLLVES